MIFVYALVFSIKERYSKGIKYYDLNFQIVWVLNHLDNANLLTVAVWIHYLFVLPMKPIAFGMLSQYRQFNYAVSPA